MAFPVSMQTWKKKMKNEDERLYHTEGCLQVSGDSLRPTLLAAYTMSLVLTVSSLVGKNW